MTVNPFWFGVLMTIVAELIVMIIFAWVNSHRNAKQEEAEADMLSQVLESMEGKKIRIVRKNGYFVGEAINDEDDEEE